MRWDCGTVGLPSHPCPPLPPDNGDHVTTSSTKNRAAAERKPQSSTYLSRQIRSRKGNIWFAKQRTLGSVGAVHAWSRGEQPALCVRTEWCTPRGHCRRPDITYTRTRIHTFSLFHTHQCAHTHTQRETITFLCFYECFINHVNGSQSYSPDTALVSIATHTKIHNCSKRRKIHVTAVLFFFESQTTTNTHPQSWPVDLYQYYCKSMMFNDKNLGIQYISQYNGIDTIYCDLKFFYCIVEKHKQCHHRPNVRSRDLL